MEERKGKENIKRIGRVINKLGVPIEQNTPGICESRRGTREQCAGWRLCQLDYFFPAAYPLVLQA